MWNNCMIIFFHATKNRHKNNKLKSGVIKLSYVQFPLKMKSLSYTFFFKKISILTNNIIYLLGSIFDSSYRH